MRQNGRRISGSTASISWASLFGGHTVTLEDDRFAYGEQRFITFGVLEGRVVAVAHTEQDDDIRIISMRKATRREEQSYFSTIPE